MIFSTTSKFFCVLKSTVLYLLQYEFPWELCPWLFFSDIKKNHNYTQEERHNALEILMGTESSKCAMHKKGHQANNCQQVFFKLRAFFFHKWNMTIFYQQQLILCGDGSTSGEWNSPPEEIMFQIREIIIVYCAKTRICIYSGGGI